MWETTELLEIIEGRRKELGLTQAEVTERAFKRSDTSAIQSIRRGSSPSVEKLAAIGQALGLELYFGPPRNRTSETEFSTKKLKHRGLAKCGIEGWSKAQEERDPLPAPSWNTDQFAFYVSATGQSMIPEGIPNGALCLVSPSRKAVPGDRVWIRDKDGSAGIKRLMDIFPDRIALRGWLPMEDGKQRNFDEDRYLNFVDEFYPITAVFRNLSASNPDGAELVPDPRIQPKSSTVSDQLEEIEAIGAGSFEARGRIARIALPSAWLRSQSLKAANCALVHVLDDHMAPGIPAQSTVLIDTTATDPSEPGTFALRQGNDPVVRFLHKMDGNRILVTAADPTFTPTTHSRSALNILGRVRWVAFST